MDSRGAELLQEQLILRVRAEGHGGRAGDDAQRATGDGVLSRDPVAVGLDGGRAVGGEGDGVTAGVGHRGRLRADDCARPLPRRADQGVGQGRRGHGRQIVGVDSIHEGRRHPHAPVGHGRRFDHVPGAILADADQRAAFAQRGRADAGEVGAGAGAQKDAVGGIDRARRFSRLGRGQVHVRQFAEVHCAAVGHQVNEQVAVEEEGDGRAAQLLGEQVGLRILRAGDEGRGAGDDADSAAVGRDLGDDGVAVGLDGRCAVFQELDGVAGGVGHGDRFLGRDRAQPLPRLADQGGVNRAGRGRLAGGVVGAVGVTRSVSPDDDEDSALFLDTILRRGRERLHHLIEKRLFGAEGHAGHAQFHHQAAVAGRGVAAAAAVAVELGEERAVLVEDQVVLAGVRHFDGDRAVVGVAPLPQPQLVDQRRVGRVGQGGGLRRFLTCRGRFVGGRGRFFNGRGLGRQRFHGSFDRGLRFRGGCLAAGRQGDQQHQTEQKCQTFHHCSSPLAVCSATCRARGAALSGARLSID